jgi:hypothetical protein
MSQPHIVLIWFVYKYTCTKRLTADPTSEELSGVRGGEDP